MNELPQITDNIKSSIQDCIWLVAENFLCKCKIKFVEAKYYKKIKTLIRKFFFWSDSGCYYRIQKTWK